MAISFSDIHTEAGARHEIPRRIRRWKSIHLQICYCDLKCMKFVDPFGLESDQLTKDDIKVFAAVLEKPSGGYPNASLWYEAVSSHLATRFPGKAVGVRFSGQAATTVAAAAQEVKKEIPEGDDDDDLDLFVDETEEEKKAAEEREAAVKASSKKKESGKSSVLLEVKPWDEKTDMKKLEEAVRSVPGLLWAKLVPVGYGMKKLQIMMTIVDDLVSIDNLIEDHLSVEPANEYIQSCDIVAFNKI